MAVSAQLGQTFCNPSSAEVGWEGSPFKHVALWINYSSSLFCLVNSIWWCVTHHKYCALTLEQLSTQTLMSPSTPFCCWQRGSAARNHPKGLPLPLHSQDGCQLPFPLAVYGARESILSRRVKHLKRRFHMWNWDVENNHLASLPLIYFPYDREINIQSLFLSS